MACIHSHAPWSLVFASSNIPLLSVTNLMDTLGEVPCLYAEDMKIKKEYLRKKIKIDIPEGMVQRPDVAAVFYNHIIPQFKDKFLRRKKELEHHGLAFTVYRHGVFVFAKNLAEAAENLSRVESNAKVAIFRKLIKNEPQIKNF